MAPFYTGVDIAEGKLKELTEYMDTELVTAALGDDLE